MILGLGFRDLGFETFKTLAQGLRVRLGSSQHRWAYEFGGFPFEAAGGSTLQDLQGSGSWTVGTLSPRCRMLLGIEGLRSPTPPQRNLVRGAYKSAHLNMVADTSICSLLPRSPKPQVVIYPLMN